MKTKAQASEQVEEVEVPVDTTPLSAFTLPSGHTCFIADRDDIVDFAQQAADEHGIQGVFYIMALYDHYKENTSTKKQELICSQPLLFKVINNLTSQAIHKVDHAASLGLKSLESQAYLTLPKIPWQMVEKMDYFFRAAYNRYGTEAILCLTYDKRCDDGSGWGFVVPEQENTSTACHYTPGSAIEMIPDEDFEYVNLVGTAHSHPQMKAYASHVDEGDQFQNDGIHITFGWTNKETEFHIDMVVANVNWKLEPSALFEEYTVPKFPEVDALLDNVKKKATTSANFQQGQKALSTGSTPTNTGPTNNADWERYLHASMPDTSMTTVVMRLLPSQPNCPSCYKNISDGDRDNRRCPRCKVYFMKDAETLEETIAKRRAKGLETLDLEGRTLDKNVWLWSRPTASEQGFPQVMVTNGIRSTPKA